MFISDSNCLVSQALLMQKILLFKKSISEITALESYQKKAVSTVTAFQKFKKAVRSHIVNQSEFSNRLRHMRLTKKQ